MGFFFFLLPLSSLYFCLPTILWEWFPLTPLRPAFPGPRLYYDQSSFRINKIQMDSSESSPLRWEADSGFLSFVAQGVAFVAPLDP